MKKTYIFHDAYWHGFHIFINSTLKEAVEKLQNNIKWPKSVIVERFICFEIDESINYIGDGNLDHDDERKNNKISLNNWIKYYKYKKE